MVDEKSPLAKLGDANDMSAIKEIVSEMKNFDVKAYEAKLKERLDKWSEEYKKQFRGQQAEGKDRITPAEIDEKADKLRPKVEVDKAKAVISEMVMATANKDVSLSVVDELVEKWVSEIKLDEKIQGMAVYGEKEKDKPRSLLYVTEDKEDRKAIPVNKKRFDKLITTIKEYFQRFPKDEYTKSLVGKGSRAKIETLILENLKKRYPKFRGKFSPSKYNFTVKGKDVLINFQADLAEKVDTKTRDMVSDMKDGNARRAVQKYGRLPRDFRRQLIEFVARDRKLDDKYSMLSEYFMGVKGEERKNNLTDIIERSGEKIPKRRTKRSRKGVTARREGSKITDEGKLRRDKIRFPKPESTEKKPIYYDFLYDDPNAHAVLIKRNPSEPQLTDMLDDLENDYEDIIEKIKALDESINRLRNLPERKELQKKRLKEDEDMRKMLPNSKNAILSEMGFILSYVKIHNENQKRKINIVFSPKIEPDDEAFLSAASGLLNDEKFESAFAQFKNN